MSNQLPATLFDLLLPLLLTWSLFVQVAQLLPTPTPTPKAPSGSAAAA